MLRRCVVIFVLLSIYTGLAEADLYMARFKRDADFFAVERAGYEPIYYLGNGKWLVGNLAKTRGVDALSAERLPPQDKLSPLLKNGIPSFAVERNRAHLLLYLNPRMDYDKALAAIPDSAEVIEFDDRWWSAEVYIPLDELSNLVSSDLVVHVEPAGAPLTLFNDGVRETVKADWGQEYLRLKGKGVVVGIWDGGWVCADHKDFSGRITLGDNSHTDSHATHVAGTIASSGVQSEKCDGKPNQWRGIAPQAEIVSYSFDNSTSEYPVAASTYGIDVANNSWGIAVGDGYGSCDLLGYYDNLAQSFDGFVIDHKMVIVFAAGNMRTSNDCGIGSRGGYNSLPPPAPAKNVLTAGAINSVSDSMTTFSSWGPTDDGRIKPDLVTPGCDEDGKGYIQSTLPDGCYGGYGWCGTSMAAPALTGCAAVTVEAYKDKHKDSPLPSTIKAALVHTARDLGAPGPDYSNGFGRPNVVRSANLIKWGAVLESSLDSVSSEKVWDIELEADYPLRVTLVWDDPPAEPGAEVALVNDLELRAVSPSGETYYPYILDPSMPAANAKTGENHTDNVEQIEISDPESGTWQIIVTAEAMPYPPQSFSIACEFLAPTNCDVDRDGFLSDACNGYDCDDETTTTHPGAIENCFDAVDNDCDGQVNEGCGGDGDSDFSDDDEGSGGLDREGRGCGMF